MAYALPRQGLGMMAESDGGNSLVEEAIVEKVAGSNSKLPSGSGRHLVRSPTHLEHVLEHGRYSIAKQHAAWEMYIECTKSMEATSKALAIRYALLLHT